MEPHQIILVFGIQEQHMGTGEQEKMIILKNGIEGKVCSTCRVSKPLSEYYRDRSHGPSQGGRHCRCKICYKRGRRQQAMRLR